MEQTQLVKQQLMQIGAVLVNDRELSHAEKIGVEAVRLLNTSFIIKVKKYDKKNIKELNPTEIDTLIEEFNEYQAAYPDSEVITLFQLGKGTRKTDGQLKTMEDSQIFANTVNITFQERDITQSENEFKQQAKSLLEKVGRKKKAYGVFEIESSNLLEKVKIALSLGIKDIIIRAGKYTDLKLWIQAINLIQSQKGTVFISLPKRMYGRERTAYIKDALAFGTDYAFHEVYSGWGSSVLHLTDNFTYANMSLSSAMTGYSDTLQESLTEKLHYSFSRVRAVHKANLLAGTVERVEI